MKRLLITMLVVTTLLAACASPPETAGTIEVVTPIPTPDAYSVMSPEEIEALPVSVYYGFDWWYGDELRLGNDNWPSLEIALLPSISQENTVEYNKQFDDGELLKIICVKASEKVSRRVQKKTEWGDEFPCSYEIFGQGKWLSERCEWVEYTVEGVTITFLHLENAIGGWRHQVGYKDVWIPKHRVKKPEEKEPELEKRPEKSTGAVLPESTPVEFVITLEQALRASGFQTPKEQERGFLGSLPPTKAYLKRALLLCDAIIFVEPHRISYHTLEPLPQYTKVWRGYILKNGVMIGPAEFRLSLAFEDQWIDGSWWGRVKDPPKDPVVLNSCKELRQLFQDW